MSSTKKLFVVILLSAAVIAIGILVFLVNQKPASNVDFQLLAIDELGCFPFFFYQNVPIYKQQVGELSMSKEMIIDSQEEYEELLKYRRKTDQVCSSVESDFYQQTCERDRQCMNQSLPVVDFTNFTVLGKYSVGSCGAYDYSRSIWRDDEEKIIVYSVYSKERMFLACSGPGTQSMNFVVIPKIPSDYKIDFKPEPSDPNNYRGYKKDPDNPGWIEFDTYGNELRSGTGVATSSGHIEFGGFADCLPQDLAELAKKNGGKVKDEDICVE